MPNFDCEITDTELNEPIDPTLNPDFVTPGYTSPTNRIQAWLSLEIFVGDLDTGTPYEFNYFLNTNSENLLEIESNFGIPGFMRFTIHDDRAVFDLPFVPVRSQIVRVRNLNQTDQYGLFYIDSVLMQPIRQRRNGSWIRLIHIECKDYFEFLELRSFNEVFQNKTSGYILRYAISRTGLGVTYIDVNDGQTFEQFVAQRSYPFDIVNRIMALEDWTYWLDYSTSPPEFRYGIKDKPINKIPLVVDEQNWTYIFDKDSFELMPDRTSYANSIILDFKIKYSKGTANVQNGSDVILGYSGDEDWYTVNPKDSQIYFPSTGASYPINKNNSDTSGTNEIIISSDYKETTANNLAYEIRSNTFYTVVVSDATAIDKMKAIRGGNGIFEKIVTRDDGYYTKQEARTIAQIELKSFSNEFIRGSARSDNIRFPYTDLFPGKVIRFELPNSHGVFGDVIIQRIVKRMSGARVDKKYRTDNRQDPLWLYEFEFSPLFERDQLRAIMMSLRKTQPADELPQIFDYEIFNDKIALKACVHVVEPITERDQNIVEFESELDTRVPPDGPFYISPSIPPHVDGSILGFTGYARMS